MNPILLPLRSKLTKNLPRELEKMVRSDFSRLVQTSSSTQDYYRIYSYLEFIADLPWTSPITQACDLSKAREELDRSHFGLSEVKKQILGFLAIATLGPPKRAPILLFLGPNGMGKVTLGMAVSRCLNRPVERLNLAAVRRQDELLGISRNQPNGYPGWLMRAFHRARVCDPVIIFEEIDHVDWSHAENPGLPLFEVLDARNTHIVDEYVNMPFDITRTWFIATANSLEGVPRVLRNQMEIVDFSGYTDDEKIEIANRFFLPRTTEAAGLGEGSVTMERDASLAIIQKYTHESGVLGLEKQIQKIIREIAKEYLSAPSNHYRLTSDQLEKYLGPEWYLRERARKALNFGVAAGLVWTDAGGEIIYVEAVRLPKGRGLILTGRLGKVMRESAETALSYLWSRSAELSIPEEMFTNAGTHVHVPAGSIPKDGPSAGITIFSALASLLLNIAIPEDIAMTGEITLTGQIFAIGGVREKCLAAHRAGFKRVLVPKQNEADLKILPDEIKNELQFILISKIEEAMDVLFPGVLRATFFKVQK